MSIPIKFGEWLPDLPPTDLQGAVTVTNVIPHDRSYQPFPQLITFSNTLGARCQGGIFASDPAQNNYNYAGDASALYRLAGQTFSSATRLAGGAYTTAAEDFWEFANWGSTVIGVNGLVDLPQQISLGGANFFDLATGFKAKHIATMRDFVVMGNISDSAANVYRVRWCAINNPTSWTPDAATLADFQDLPSEGGPIQKVLGGEYGVVLQQRSVWRMQFVGSPLVFQFDRIHNAIGAYAPQAAVRYQNLVFFLAVDGFYEFDGSQLNPIGRGKIDKFFLSDLNNSYINRTQAVIDPTNKLVMWAYASGSSSGGNPDKLIIYSWAFNRWTLVEGLNIEYLLQNITSGLTLDGLDVVSSSIDNISVSLDSLQWTGGQIILAAFNATHQLARFNGSAMAATCETGEFQLFQEHRSTLFEVRPTLLGLSASCTISVIIRNNLTESASVGALAVPPNATGFSPVRTSSRYFRIRLQIAASINFTHLIGVEVSGTMDGVR